MTEKTLFSETATISAYVINESEQAAENTLIPYGTAQKMLEFATYPLLNAPSNEIATYQLTVTVNGEINAVIEQDRPYNRFRKLDIGLATHLLRVNSDYPYANSFDEAHEEFVEEADEFDSDELHQFNVQVTLKVFPQS